MNFSIGAAVCVVVGFTISFLSAPFIIPLLRKLKFGQSILEIGPKWHKGKSGTPTMGGLIFIIATGFSGAIFIRDLTGAFALVFSLFSGLIGFIDDYIKVAKKRNRGLSPMAKIILMLLITTAFSVSGIELGVIETTLHIPFTGIYIDLGYYIAFFLVFMMIGFINSVNLTDGIDGLAASVTTVVTMFFALLSMVFMQKGLTMFSASLCGSLIGFLIYNLNPAKVFMGDTGSLFLGGAVTSLAVLIGEPLIIVIVGIVYLWEAVSVMLQVGYFKISGGKRIFKMAPFHHHLEMCGYSENKIVVIFSFITLIASVIAYLSVV